MAPPRGVGERAVSSKSPASLPDARFSQHLRVRPIEAVIYHPAVNHLAVNTRP